MLDLRVAGINPFDLVVAAGKVPAWEREHPSVPGVEGIGELDGVRYYFDRPIAPFGSMGERAAVERDSMIEVPDGVSDSVAVSLGVAGFAAWLALTWQAELQEGESVLVLGASGVVGQIAVQGARILGAGKVVAATRDERGLERARDDLGADEVVRLGGGDLVSELKEAVGGGYDVVIDPLWGEPAMAALSALNMRGRLVQLGNSAGEEAALASRGLRSKLGNIIGHNNYLAPLEVKREAYETMAGHAASGALTVEAEERPLAEVAEVWEAQKGSPHHKQVLRVSE